MASSADNFLFIHHVNNYVIILLVYVDDIIITGSYEYVISQFLKNLHSLFAMKNPGPFKYFLGIEALWSSNNLYICQSKYLFDLVHGAKMIGAKPISSPIVSGSKLSLYDGDPLPSSFEYRSIVGVLQYLTLIRPDITFVVNQVSQFMHAPLITHWAW